MCFELFKTRNGELIKSIASKRLVSVVQETNKLRNDWMGHSGAVRDADARAVNESLLQHIGTVREAFGVCWENYELLLPQPFTHNFIHPRCRPLCRPLRPWQTL